MMPHRSYRAPARRRTRLRAGCATAAVAALAGPLASAAVAQAFNGTPTVVAGAVSFDRTTPGVETITVLDDAIVNWSPVEGPGGIIDFLPAGNTATFQDSVGDGGFVILNRVLPTGTGIVELNGNIVSQLQTGAGTARGGLVAFYSPTGILVGSTAVFDVGSLILAAADPDPATFQDFGNGSGALSFAAAPGSTARVEVLPGATIEGTAENSFLAMVAPQVVMGGTARINGSTAYVAAEAVNLTLINGLFDIVVTAGTSVADAIIHTGSTGGPSRTGTDANQAIYAVGVGQSQAVQLLFSGNLGFDPATDASVVNGEVILSAGSSVEGRDFIVVPGAAPADLIVGNVTVSSTFSGSATRDAIVGANNTGDSVFESDVAVRGTASAGLYGNGGNLLVVGDAKVSADIVARDVGVTDDPALADATAGLARVVAENGGSVTIQGDATVSANATGGNGPDGGDATGGSAGLIAIGGDIQVGGAIVATADAVGGNAAVGFGGRGGAAEGGTVFIQAESPGAGRLVGNAAALSANGAGGSGGAGDGASIGAGAGGEGRGGLYDQALNSGGAFVLAGIDQGNVALTDITLEAIGTGGAGGTGGTGQAGGAGGAAFGGTTQIGSYRGAAPGNLGGSVAQFTTAVANSSATGGAGGNGPTGTGAGGDATGGGAYATGTSGGLVTADNVVLMSNVQAGAGGTGGNATGGQAGISTVGAIEIVDATIQARTLGGAGADGSVGTATGGNLVVETAAGVSGSVGTVEVETLTGDIITQGNAATSMPGTADLLVPVGEARFTRFQVADPADTALQAAPAASRISTGGLVTFLEAADFQVQGDIEISTTGFGRILGGPDPSTPTAFMFITSTDATISIAGANDAIVNLGGQYLQLRSNDLEIAEGARIGGVALALLANDAGGLVTLGGDAQGPGYTLTQAEAARIEAGSVIFSGSDVIVRDLTISGSPDDGPSLVELEADNVSVQGHLVYLAGPGDVLSIDVADGLLEVITPTGSISVNDGETLSGRLEIEAATTIVADAELAGRIKADPNFDGLAAALATNNGPDNPEGYLQASIIEFSFDGEPGEGQKAVYIQNSGNDTTFGGTAARIPGLIFTLEDDDDEAVQVRLIGYGAGLDAAGNVVTNAAYASSVELGQAQGITYTDDSEFNAIFVNTGQPARPGGGQNDVGGAIVGSEVIFGPLAQVVTPEPGDEDRDLAFGGAFPGLINASDLALDPAIDQPVASGGDSALWRGRSSEDDEEDENEEGESGQER